ncbi:MAG: hypothetical protein ACXWNK_02110 [Vulcanimicrobiaceae bacterium]
MDFTDAPLQDAYFIEWMLDLHSLDGPAYTEVDIETWDALYSTYVEALIRDN